MMNNKLNEVLSAINKTLSDGYRTLMVLKVVRAIFLSLATASLWAVVASDRIGEQLLLGLVTFVVAMAIKARKKPLNLSENDLILALEIKNPEMTMAASNLKNINDRKDPVALSRWTEPLKSLTEDTKKSESERNRTFASSLISPLVIILITLPFSSNSLSNVISEVTKAVNNFDKSMTLKVVQGAATELEKDTFKLSTSSPLELELLTQNFIEISVKDSGFGKALPIVELRNPKSENAKNSVYQSFQLLPERTQSNTNANTVYKISIAVSTNVELFIPAIDSGSPLALIKVKNLPLPKVKISQVSPIEDPWPDDKPIILSIKVDAENPLQTVRLVIRSGGRSSKETVANVLSEDKRNIDSTYSLVLEPYVQSDIAQVEIFAEAIDRAVPTPLMGVSNILQLTTASAYGRYRSTLTLLRELKTHVDESVEKLTPSLPPKTAEIAANATAKSENSPFFDGLDRVSIRNFERSVNEVGLNKNVATLIDLSSDLNDFLLEHEILDARERDRDFFVAARGLSRLIEHKREDRPVEVLTVSDRLIAFLNDRYKYWTLRVSRLDPPPASWASHVEKKPFHGYLEQISNLDLDTKKNNRNGQLQILSKTVKEYREWIEELEKLEDSQRQEQERKRQQGLASAKDSLKELQKRQGKITTTLDKAKLREEEVASSWASTRMKQNTNVEQTNRLENQMRAMAPKVAMRVKAAAESMKNTVESGNSNNFDQAESASDLAGRLLRQAQKAASQPNQKRQKRGSRRRVTGDNYYGQSVVGGDVEIKREYQVDKRYREDILNEVLNNPTDQEDKALLENYLRQVLR